MGSDLARIELAKALDFAARMFLAVMLGVMVSFRRKMTRHDHHVLQAHAFLATAGAMFMTIIGEHLIRAVGLLAVASVVRYRYAIRNPRDAGTLIIALGLGMACGSGMLAEAFMGGLFVMVMSYVLERLPRLLIFPRIRQREQINLRVLSRDLDASIKRITEVFERYDISYMLRTMAQKTSEQKAGMSEIEMLVEYPIEVNLSQLTYELSDEDVVRISWENPKGFFY